LRLYVTAIAIAPAKICKDISKSAKGDFRNPLTAGQSLGIKTMEVAMKSMALAAWQS
jgi:hypothetical protein